MKKITVNFIRHGETYFNVFDRFQGWSDTPLTAHGHAQAQAIGAVVSSLKVDHLYASDMTRARETAADICQVNHWDMATTLTCLPSLREHFYGCFEGQSQAETWRQISEVHGLHNYSELVQTYSVDQAQDFLSQQDASGFAETSADFWNRFLEGIQTIMKATPDNGEVLVVSHSSVIRALVGRYAPQRLNPITPENGKLTRICVSKPFNKPIDFRVLAYNCTTINAANSIGTGRRLI